MNERQKLEMIFNSVACCGLICALDSCFENCDGCRMGKGCGDNHCFQKECCAEKGLYGCWECFDFPCGKGYFSDQQPSKGQFVGCIKFIREVGVEKYVKRVIENIDIGIKYGLGGGYAGRSENEVLRLLRNIP